MRSRHTLFRLLGVEITADGTVVAGLGLLWGLFTLVGLRAFRLQPAAALGGGLLAALLHLVAEMWHQLGHARAARQAGHPMERLDMWGVIGTSVYPSDEGPLPDDVHIRRALGGPQASAALTIFAGLLAVLTRPRRGITHMTTSIFALDNLLVFTLGAFLPLPFLETDGVTLLRHTHPRHQPMVVIKE